jgi:hypothetical protein
MCAGACKVPAKHACLCPVVSLHMPASRLHVCSPVCLTSLLLAASCLLASSRAAKLFFSASSDSRRDWTASSSAAANSISSCRRHSHNNIYNYSQIIITDRITVFGTASRATRKGARSSSFQQHKQQVSGWFFHCNETMQVDLKHRVLAVA